MQVEVAAAQVVDDRLAHSDDTDVQVAVQFQGLFATEAAHALEFNVVQAGGGEVDGDAVVIAPVQVLLLETDGQGTVLGHGSHGVVHILFPSLNAEGIGVILRKDDVAHSRDVYGVKGFYLARLGYTCIAVVGRHG